MAGRDAAERILRHPVAVTLDDERHISVAASVGGDPPQTRVAWIDGVACSIVARIGCPPGRPSRLRPVVATDVELVQGGIDDRVIAIRAAPGVTGVAVRVADSVAPPPVAVGPEGVALVRVEPGLVVVGVDALEGDEPVGRLDAGGIAHLILSGGKMSGRFGSGHGLAAGFGAGRWTVDPVDAAFEAGYEPVMPTWIPDGLDRGAFHLEPDPVYPFAPPAVVVAWGVEPRRVLVRQTPAPLAVPIAGSGRTELVAVGAAEAVLMARGRFATVVWETAERAFGVQVVGIDGPADAALRVARSIDERPAAHADAEPPTPGG